jgi:hypothetical protein
MKNVISFCLFGNNPKYLIGAEENAKLAKQIFPDWECRFYIDIETVPTETINKLKKYSNTNIISKKRNYEYDGLFWRFEPIREFDVDVWISRDVDSRLSIKEKLAVEDWINNSDKTFHLMRDSANHDLMPIMAGMFGVKNKQLREKYGYIDFEPNNVYFRTTRDGDQYMLQENVWTIFKLDHVCHEYWAFNKPSNKNLSTCYGRNPDDTYFGQGVYLHVLNRRKNYPDQFLSDNRPFPDHPKLEFGDYLGQIILENNEPIMNADVQWELELRGIHWKK